MDKDKDAILQNGLRYLKIYRDQGRSRCDRIVPGQLVAEILRYIENSMAGRSQYDLEHMLLGTNQLGAQWRAYVAHPRRDAEERKAWRTWYGRHGCKNSVSEQRTEDPFAIQPPPLPQLDEGEVEISLLETEPPRPLMRALPYDGRSMTFHLLREVIRRWSTTVVARYLAESTSQRCDNASDAERALSRHTTSLVTIRTSLNAWEAAYELLTLPDSPESTVFKTEFFQLFQRLEERDQERDPYSHNAGMPRGR
ncbi:MULTISPECIES: hypothetical protein [Pseudomonas]|uniref:hypothetical protein n=1 Tax=Pseudomonas TaxID=286 RepID=UPI000BA431B3|nr:MULTISPECIES: hypothetical protein [Pseudomonas]NVZ72588.1 hypothetical protein [Pseudomonas costantinii]